MKQRIGILLSTLLLLAAPLSISIASPMLVAAATPQDEICSGVGLTGSSGTGCGDQGKQAFQVIGTIINVLSVLIGIASVVMIMIAGFRFITSGGDSGKVAAARSGIVYAIIGLIVVVLAQAIVHFVIGAAR